MPTANRGASFLYAYITPQIPDRADRAIIIKVLLISFIGSRIYYVAYLFEERGGTIWKHRSSIGTF